MRSLILDEAIEERLTSFLAEDSTFFGVLVGGVYGEKTLGLVLVEGENSGESTDKSVKEAVKEVRRLLVGGFQIIGFCLSAKTAALAELLKASTARLRKSLLFLQNSEPAFCSPSSLLVLTHDRSNRKLQCHQLSSVEATASLTPVTVKTQKVDWSALVAVSTVVGFSYDLVLDKRSDDLYSNIKESLRPLLDALKQATVHDSKTGKQLTKLKNANWEEVTMSVPQFSPLPVSADSDELFRSQVVHFYGTVDIRSYHHEKFSTDEDVLRNLICDVERCLLVRCYFLGDETDPTEPAEDPITYELPKRIFFKPVTGHDITFSDFMHSDETLTEVRERLGDLFGWDIDEEDIEESRETEPPAEEDLPQTIFEKAGAARSTGVPGSQGPGNSFSVLGACIVVAVIAAVVQIAAISFDRYNY